LSDSPHATTLGPAPLYSCADLTGNWFAYGLDSGTLGPWWQQSTFTNFPDCTFSGTRIDSKGHTGTISGAGALYSDGIITSGGSDTTSVDADATVMVGTDTQTAGPGELRVSIKRAVSYSQSDLQGRWYRSALAGSPGAPWWDVGDLDGGRRTILHLLPSESDGEKGVRFHIYSKRIGRLLGIEVESVKDMLPAGADDWVYAATFERGRQGDHDGYAGFIRKDAEVDRL
jgi:hypothetical protein